VLRFGNGAYLRPKEKENQKREEEGKHNFPFAKIWPCVQEATKKMKKGEQIPSLSNLGNGVLKATKKTKQKREHALCLPRVGDGVAKATKKNEKRGSLALPLPRLGDGTQELAKEKRKKGGASSPSARTW
jgi:hypothetical protein